MTLEADGRGSMSVNTPYAAPHTWYCEITWEPLFVSNILLLLFSRYTIPLLHYEKSNFVFLWVTGNAVKIEDPFRRGFQSAELLHTQWGSAPLETNVVNLASEGEGDSSEETTFPGTRFARNRPVENDRSSSRGSKGFLLLALLGEFPGQW